MLKSLRLWNSPVKTILPVCLLAGLFLTTHSLDAKEVLAAKPPMGWNSFDAYDCRINEQEFKATVDFMAEHLLQYGWEYAIIDYIWWHPDPGNWETPRRFGHPNIRYGEDGKPIDVMPLDEYGRCLPAPERFPSAKGGKGFKPIADYVHAKGMKFGIHIMRGIHRQAVYDNSPILGSTARAADIAEPWDVCGFCNHMWGVDPTKPGAQEYYNSLFKLYAAWGVDFVKADDMMYPVYHKGEIEMIRKALDQCGRPMVLSLSCGEAPLSQAQHLAEQSNLWRISADFWDRWPDLEHMFSLLNSWSPWIGNGHWPDADMIAIGRLSLNNRPHGLERESRFTWPEHDTLMTLWCMARSPLMIGSDLVSSSERTLAYFKNPEVLAVNQDSTDNRQVFNIGGHVCWIATEPQTGDRYVALFNLNDDDEIVRFNMEMESVRGKYAVRDLWQRKDVGFAESVLSARVEPHGAKLFRLHRVSDSLIKPLPFADTRPPE